MWLFRSGRAPRHALGAAVLLAGLGACSAVPRIVTEYRIDVQQGNVLSQEMVSQLKVGLTRDQVRFLLGTPLLTDIFHEDRWDYVYRLEKGRTGEVEQRRVAVFFDKEGKLSRVSGDVVAADPAAGVEAQPDPRARVIDLGSIPEGTPIPPPEEKGIVRRTLDKLGL